jgi:hypothetical protein
VRLSALRAGHPLPPGTHDKKLLDSLKQNAIYLMYIKFGFGKHFHNSEYSEINYRREFAGKPELN